MSIYKTWNNSESIQRNCCRCIPVCPPVCPPPPVTNPQFLSSYLEAVGDTQEILTNNDVVFDSNPETLDIVGNGISLNSAGRIFTIMRPGLYHIEWSMNVSNGEAPIVIGIMENGGAASAIASTATSGVISSGALINVTTSNIPMTISLHNFGGLVDIESPLGFQNTAVSIRILRFADGALS